MQRTALLGCAAAIMFAAPATIAFNPATPSIGNRVRNANALRRGVLGHAVSRSERTCSSCSFYPPVPPSAARSGTGLVVLRAKKRVSARRLEKMDREDPEYQAILARQKEMTAAMRLLQQWDEEQTEFVLERADPSAPLGDWAGLRRVPEAEERAQMRAAIELLTKEAAYVLIGMNCDSISGARSALDQWLAGLGLLAPACVPFLDDTLDTEWASLDDMDAATRAEFAAAVHIAYNSEAGAGDGDAPAAHFMAYPAADRGVVFTPILEGFFTQYGDLPLDLFDLAADASPSRAELQAPGAGGGAAGGVAARQHAQVGNPQAAAEVARMNAEAAAEEGAGAPWGPAGAGECEG